MVELKRNGRCLIGSGLDVRESLGYFPRFTLSHITKQIKVRVLSPLWTWRKIRTATFFRKLRLSTRYPTYSQQFATPAFWSLVRKNGLTHNPNQSPSTSAVCEQLTKTVHMKQTGQETKVIEQESVDQGGERSGMTWASDSRTDSDPSGRAGWWNTSMSSLSSNPEHTVSKTISIQWRACVLS